MKWALAVILIYWMISVVLEVAVLPQLALAAPLRLEGIFDLRLMALAGILAGLLRGETIGMLLALASAAIAGFAEMPGFLGANIVSYVSVAFLAGVLARSLTLQGTSIRIMVILGLLAIQSALWLLVRKLFWPGSEIAWHLPGMVLTALLGALLMRWLAPRFKDSQLLTPQK